MHGGTQSVFVKHENLIIDVKIMHVKAVLSVIIVFSVVCNLFAIYFIRRNGKKKKKEITLKEKVVFLLCTLNLCNIIGYTIRLHAATVGETKEANNYCLSFIEEVEET